MTVSKPNAEANRHIRPLPVRESITTHQRIRSQPVKAERVQFIFLRKSIREKYALARLCNHLARERRERK